MNNSKIVHPERIAIVCQCDVNEKYLRDAEYLFKSLDHYGGKLSSSNKFILLNGKSNSEIKTRFTNLGVIIQEIESIDSRDIFANKIRNLQITPDKKIDYIVSLDVDILVSNDFTDFLDSNNIAAKCADMTPLNITQWKTLFDFFRLEIPNVRYKTHFDLEETIPYFNTGVILVPEKFSKILYEEWKFYVKSLLDSYKILPEAIRKHSHFNNQFAFSLALSHSKLPFRDLPLEMNFPSHHPINNTLQPELKKPYLIHHHHQYTNDGYFQECNYENINHFFRQVNSSIIGKN